MVSLSLTNLYSQYLESKTNIWCESTLRSESKRLNSLLASPAVSLDPVHVWGQLAAQGLAPYTRNTAWVRLIDFADFLVSNGFIQEHGFREFRQKNPQIFRNAYERKIPEIGYEEAVRLLNSIPPRSREKAMQLLRNAMRLTESHSLRDGRVRGKGGKFRRVFNDSKAVEYILSDATFRRDLAKAELTPHMLRKIAISQLRKLGADIFTLKKFAGWSSIATAQSYVEACDSEVAAIASKLK